MDEDTVIPIAVASTFITLIIAFTVGMIINGQQKVEFAKNCVNAHKSVTYSYIGNKTVSECK